MILQKEKWNSREIKKKRIKKSFKQTSLLQNLSSEMISGQIKRKVYKASRLTVNFLAISAGQ